MKKILLALTALISVGALSWLYGMNTGAQAANQNIVTITQGEQTITIPRDIALQFLPFKDTLEDVAGESTIPLSESAPPLAAIHTIVSIIQAIQNNPELTRPDGIYIAQRIQPIIDQQLAQKSIQDINQIIRALIYLGDLPYITNGAIRVVVHKELQRDNTLSVNKIIATLYPILPLKHNLPLIKKLTPLYKKQYTLIKKDNVPELSILDYIAINGQPAIRIVNNLQTLNLSEKELTSLEGLHTINNINTMQVLYLNNNSLTTLPLGIFNELTALQGLNLSNNNLTTLPAGIFNELTALQRLHLYNNRLQTTVEQIRQQNNNLGANVQIIMGTQRP